MRLYIILIMLALLSCNSMLQNKGKVVYENHYYHNFSHGGVRYVNSDTNFISSMEVACEVEKIELETHNKLLKNYEEVKKMEQPEIVTMITSIIAGLYAVVKTIINLIKKIKK